MAFFDSEFNNTSSYSFESARTFREWLVENDFEEISVFLFEYLGIESYCDLLSITREDIIELMKELKRDKQFIKKVNWSLSKRVGFKKSLIKLCDDYLDWHNYRNDILSNTKKNKHKSRKICKKSDTAKSNDCCCNCGGSNNDSNSELKTSSIDDSQLPKINLKKYGLKTSTKFGLNDNFNYNNGNNWNCKNNFCVSYCHCSKHPFSRGSTVYAYHGVYCRGARPPIDRIDNKNNIKKVENERKQIGQKCVIKKMADKACF